MSIEPEPSTESSTYPNAVAPWIPTTALWVGLAASFVGLVDGIVQMLRRREVGCPDGTFFPNGTTDFRCWSHPHAATGLAITTTSVALAAIIVMVGVLLAYARPPVAPPTDTD